MKICTCNNCGNVFEDTNPGNDSVEYPETISVNELKDNACPVCKTDGYLQDNINVNAGGNAEKLQNIIDAAGKAGHSIENIDFTI